MFPGFGFMGVPIAEDRRAFEDRINTLMGPWDEKTEALVYLQLYRRGMRSERAEGIVRRAFTEETKGRK